MSITLARKVVPELYFSFKQDELPVLNPYDIAIDERVLCAHSIHSDHADFKVRVRICDEGIAFVMMPGSIEVDDRLSSIYTKLGHIDKASVGSDPRRPILRNPFMATEPMDRVRIGDELVFWPWIAYQDTPSARWNRWGDDTLMYRTPPVFQLAVQHL